MGPIVAIASYANEYRQRGARGVLGMVSEDAALTASAATGGQVVAFFGAFVGAPLGPLGAVVGMTAGGTGGTALTNEYLAPAARDLGQSAYDKFISWF